MTVSVYLSLCKGPILIARLKLNLKFLDRFFKNIHIRNFMKFHLVQSRVIPCGGTDRSSEAKSRLS